MCGCCSVSQELPAESSPAQKFTPMYKKILVALENGRADETLVPHIADLAHRLGSALLLVHVADGWAARNFVDLKLAESAEMKADREYLADISQRLIAGGLIVTTE